MSNAPTMTIEASFFMQARPCPVLRFAASAKRHFGDAFPGDDAGYTTGDTNDISSYIQRVMNICGDFEAVYRLPEKLSTFGPAILCRSSAMRIAAPKYRL